MKTKLNLKIVVPSLVVFVILTFLFNFVFIIGRREGASMKPTMSEHGISIGYRLEGEYKAGDIVMAKPEGGKWNGEEIIAKRILGVPGDNIVVDGVKLYINGVLIDSSVPGEGYGYTSYKLAADEYFLVGDNRANSLDSRARGPVKESELIAKVVFWFN